MTSWYSGTLESLSVLLAYPYLSELTDTASPSANSCHVTLHLFLLQCRRVFDPQLHTQLVTSKGKVLTELLELLSGKQVPGKVGRGGRQGWRAVLG
jgi:hypothetical protein